MSRHRGGRDQDEAGFTHQRGHAVEEGRDRLLAFGRDLETHKRRRFLARALNGRRLETQVDDVNDNPRAVATLTMLIRGLALLFVELLTGSMALRANVLAHAGCASLRIVVRSVASKLVPELHELPLVPH